ncbi:hypothetical protein BDW59DRAFT_120212 [Aspergillus cavernicola]|uniref:Mucin n=1 Tax=Aspergillus cavernicola TaxID=176166 RepID=A0ABR4HWX5_9EURO
MEHSLYDSFRWLDEDTDLDLSLDNYQQQVTNSSSYLPPRRRPSFRRTLSFNSVNMSRKSISLPSYGRAPVSSPPVESQSALASIISRRSSLSRPSSKGKPRHASQSSTSSIDPSAQYFHDPEARLKLRVYLASPQNFDETIEFGFPALKEKGVINTEPVRPDSKSQVRGFKGTFLDDGDDDASIPGDKEPCSNISRLSYVLENPQGPQNPPIVDNNRHLPLSEPKTPRNPNTREMTLRMTLTRPDLRADSCRTPTSVTDPTNPLQLSLADDNSEFWEQDTDDQNLMKKMWRKLRRRKY